MRWFLILMLVGCAGDDDDCGDVGAATTVDLHTRLVGAFLDPPDADASSVQLQDGGPACPWRVVAGAGTGHYALAVHHARFAVAVTCGKDVTVLGRSRDDSEPLETQCFASAPASDGHVLTAHANGAGEPYVLQTFVGDQPTERHGFDHVDIAATWHARGGQYDLVARGHAGDTNLDAPDQLRIVRGLLATDDPDVDVSPANAAGWVAFGPPLTASVGKSIEAFLGYRTAGGTVVDLGHVLGDTRPATGELPTWPVGAEAPGDLYLQALFFDDAQFNTRSANRQSATLPTAFDLTIPPAFDITRTGDAFAIVPLPDAERYVLSCAIADRVFVNVLSAGWLGADTGYALPVLDGVSYGGCLVWDASAHGHTSADETWRTTTSLP